MTGGDAQLDRDGTEDGGYADVRDGGDWNFLHEELIPTLVVAGVLLFLFPDPVTSTFGIVLVGIGVALWAWDVVR